jgi:hypothetical protein
LLNMADPSGMLMGRIVCGQLAHKAIQTFFAPYGAVTERTCHKICTEVEGGEWKTTRSYCATGTGARVDVYLPSAKCIAEIKPLSPNLAKRKFRSAFAQLSGYLALLNDCCCIPVSLCDPTGPGFNGGPIEVGGCGTLWWSSQSPGLITYMYTPRPKKNPLEARVPVPVPVPWYEPAPTYEYRVPVYLRPLSYVPFSARALESAGNVSLTIGVAASVAAAVIASGGTVAAGAGGGSAASQRLLTALAH